MASRREFQMSPPQQVYDAYKEMLGNALIVNKSLDEKNIVEFQQSLNKSQPRNDEESKSRSLIQYLYRKNPTTFYRFLVRSRLSHLILWTETKCIVRHFGLRGIVYVKWNDNEYICSLHKNVNNNLETYVDDEHPSIQNTYKTIGHNFGNYNGDNNQERGRRPREYVNVRGGRDRGGGSRYQRDGGRDRSGGSRYQRDDGRSSFQHRYQEQQKIQIPDNTEVNFPTLPKQEHSREPVVVENDEYSPQYNTDDVESMKPNLYTSVDEVLLTHNKPVKHSTQLSYSNASQSNEVAST